MTTSSASTDASVRSIKHETQSISTNNTTTLNILRAVLGYDLVPQPRSTGFASNAKCVPKVNKKPMPEPVKRRKPKRGNHGPVTDLEIFETPETLPPPLPIPERQKLATETFNTTLKCLSNAAKNADPKENAQGRRHAEDTQLCQTPLQNRSPNRRAAPDLSGKPTKGEKQPNVEAPADPGPTASCASLCLETLRRLSLDNSKGAKQLEATAIRLERGALILLDKLITLDLKKHALHVACGIKISLEGNKCQLDHLSPLVPDRSEAGYNGVALYDLLQIKSSNSTKELFELITSYQSQLMRLVLLLGQDAISPTLLESLQLSTAFGPCGIILKGLESGHISSEQSCRQLRTLSQAIMNLCASRRGTTRPESSAEVLLRLRCLALEIRCYSFQVLQSAEDIGRDIWTHFGRALKRYRDETKLSESASYTRVKDVLGCLRLAPGLDQTQMQFSVCDILAEMASRASDASDAIRFLEPFSRLGEGDQDLRGASCICRIATLQLHNWKENSCTALAAAERALGALKSNLKGSSVEFSDLLLHGTRLRKTAASVASDIETLRKERMLDEIEAGLQSSVIKIIFAFQHYLLRCLRSVKQNPSEAADPLKQVEKEFALCAVVQKTSECVVSISKLSASMGANLWADVDAALQEALLVAAVQKERRSATNHRQTGHTAEHSISLHVSGAYWHWYIEGKDGWALCASPLAILQRSVNAIESCSIDEQLLGILPQKYERLASLYTESRNLGNAHYALQQGITLLIKAGTLTEAVEIALSRPGQHVWSQQLPNTYILGKFLTAIANLTMSKAATTKQDVHLFDDVALPDVHRALVLEKQILACAEKPLPEQAQAVLIAASKTVFDLYKASKFHVYRLQFACELLGRSFHNSQFPIFQILSLREKILIPRDPATFKQCFLAEYGAALQARTLLLAFQRRHFDTGTLFEALDHLDVCIMKCKNHHDLQTTIDDEKALDAILCSSADHAGMLGLHRLRLKALNVRRRLLELQGPQGSTTFAVCVAQIGSLQCRLGYTLEASRNFAVAERLLVNMDASTDAVHLSLFKTEYLLNLGNLNGALENLVSAGRIHALALARSEETSSRSRLQKDAQLAQASLLAASLALEYGDIAGALIFGKQSVKLSTGIWMCIEKQWELVVDSNSTTSSDCSLQNIADGMANVSLSMDTSIMKSASKGVHFWPYVDLHIRALLQISSLCCHSGLYQDALYYAEQAKKVGATVQSARFLLKCRLAIALLHAQSGLGNPAIISTETVEFGIEKLDQDLETLHMLMDVSRVYSIAGDLDKAQEVLRKSRRVMEMIQMADSQQTLPTPASQKPEKQTVSTKIGSVRKTNQIGALSKTVSSKKRPMTKPIEKNAVFESNIVESYSPNRDIQSVRTALTMLEARYGLLRGDNECAVSRLTEMISACTLVDTHQETVLQASTSLAQALEAFSSDTIHCVLDETAIGLPSQYKFAQVQDTKATTKRPQSSKTIATTAKKPKNARKQIVEPKQSQSSATSLLLQAHRLISTSPQHQISAMSTHEIHEEASLYSRIALLSSVVGIGPVNQPVELLQRLLVPKDWTRNREHLVMEAENATMTRVQVQTWPMLKMKAAASSYSSETCDGKAAYLGNIPSSWTILSLSLSEDKTEVIVSRQAAGRQPFILRLPLSRSNAEDIDQVEFSFSDARDELKEIVQAANITAHDARSQADKSARKNWWAERENLDKRLEALLMNIENLWFGGFRGILTQSPVDQGLVPRFAESLSRTLDKHLPSRQRSIVSTTAKVQLHAHVIELFLTLGNPDDKDLDDAISDLLYFVVDILQFSGERNAYDEIDFDMILMEVLEALRSYYETSATTVSEGAKHTILILDKELHGFPWESMSCMSGQSVSRMPCMQEVRDRMELMREKDEEASYHTISRKAGSYILNPSSDLTSTQSTFATCFQSQLPNFSSIVNQIPTEAEFTSCLRDNELFLYFGHGSGAQYIRGRTIKKLERCAVTFLMGCSSGKMTECGMYEPYGVPWNYMFAGSPAVVGTLWDVTDKDIDRFALRAFVNWGLLDRSTEEEQTKAKASKSKKKGRLEDREEAHDEDNNIGLMTLDEAVAKARGACVLKYLNGAAPVVYGIPVMLD